MAKVIPHGPTRSTIDTLGKGQLIMFENEQTPLIGLILDLKKDRYIVLNERDRELDLTPQRIHKLPAAVDAKIMSGGRSVQGEFLRGLRQRAEQLVATVDVKTLWESVGESDRVFNEQELLELLLDSQTLELYVAFRLALLGDRLYFKRDKSGFIPRPQETVEQLMHSEHQRSLKIKRELDTIQYIQSRLSGAEAEPPPELEPTIRLLGECAAGSERIDHTKQREVKDFLNLFTEKTEIELHGDLQERAYTLLLRIRIFHKNTNLIRYRFQPREAFSPEVIHCAERLQTPETPDEWPQEYKKLVQDISHLEAVTIDDQSTLDMDDALTIEQTPDGYRLGIHISCVAIAFDLDNPIACEARLRATSLYSPDFTINMLPEKLSEDTLSLVAGRIRPCLSCFVELGQQFQIRSTTIFPSLIRVARRLSYDEVDNLLNHDDHDLSVLYNIASHLTQMRLESGAVQIQKGDASVSLSDDGSMSLQEIDEQSPARSLVGEMMVLANSVMAECAATNDVPLIFRGQPHPDRNRSIDPSIPDGPARDYAQRSLLKKSTVSTLPEPHASLGLKAYAQITSPIRRYADIVNQKQLLCWLSTGQPYFTHSDLQEIIRDTEETLSRANQISRESKRFWLLRYIEEHRQDSTLLCGTVIRTDLKFPIVELDRTYLTVQARCHSTIKLGDRVRLKLNVIKPAFDEIRLEQI